MKGKRILFVFALAVVLVFAMTAVALAATFTVTWNGTNGADKNEPGADLHWVVSGGGDADAYAAITDASILITYSDGTTTATFPLLKVAGAEMQFDTTGVDGLTVQSAVVTYEAPSALAEDALLKISHINVEETTTSEAVTTTEVGEETTVPTESTTTTQADLTTANSIATGGGGASGGPGAGTWALGILALALAGGLGWTAVRPALKRK